MNETAVFKLTYGVFFIGCADGARKNVCVINTVAQVTQEPLRVSATVLKSNLTHDMILSARQFSVGIMGESVSLDDISHFGAQSGRDVDKLAGYSYKTDVLGNPLVDNGCIGSLCCKVIQTVDLGTHTLFIADIVDAEVLSNDEPLTYNNYRAIKSGKRKPAGAESAQEQEASKTYQCKICHYVYDGETPFEELPDDYVCPICKQPKSAFIAI